LPITLLTAAKRKRKMTITEGIVLKERIVGEQDKFIDILTKEHGLMEISVKGARKINGKSGSSAQLFAYSRFCVDKRRDRFYLNSAEPIHIFYGLRQSVSRISLAGYFAEVLRYSTAELTDSGNVLRLFLNTLHFLEKGTRDEVQLKAIFELRLMSETGFMPDIVGCRNCGKYEPQSLYFSVSDGSFCCEDCFGDRDSTGCMKVSLSVLTAVRHIVLADMERIFNFRLSEDSMNVLAEFAESYLISHLERHFPTLDFYRSVT